MTNIILRIRDIDDDDRGALVDLIESAGMSYSLTVTE